MSSEKWSTYVADFAAYGVKNEKTSRLIILIGNQEELLGIIDPDDDLPQAVMIERFTLLLNIVCDEIDRRLPHRCFDGT